MHYFGTLGEVRETVTAARDALGHVERIGMSLRGLSGTMLTPAAGYTSLTTNEDGSVSATYPSGSIATYYTDGTISIVNAEGQDVTANYIGTATGSGTPSTWQQIASSLSDSLSNAPNTLSSAASSIAGNALPWIAVGVLALGAVYLMSRK